MTQAPPRGRTPRPRLRAWLVFVLSNAFAFVGGLSLSSSLPESSELSTASITVGFLTAFLFVFGAPYLAATLAFTLDARTAQRVKPAVTVYLISIAAGALMSIGAIWWFAANVGNSPVGGLVIMALIPIWWLGAAVATAVVYGVVRLALARQFRTISRQP